MREFWGTRACENRVFRIDSAPLGIWGSGRISFRQGLQHEAGWFLTPLVQLAFRTCPRAELCLASSGVTRRTLLTRWTLAGMTRRAMMTGMTRWTLMTRMTRWTPDGTTRWTPARRTPARSFPDKWTPDGTTRWTPARRTPARSFPDMWSRRSTAPALESRRPLSSRLAVSTGPAGAGSDRCPHGHKLVPLLSAYH